MAGAITVRFAESAPDYLHQAVLISVTDSDIHPFDTNSSRVPVHIATCSQYQSTGIQSAEGAQMMPALTVGDMSHRARIKNVDIGVLIGGYYAKPGIEEFGCQRCALRLVELAANGLKSNSRSGTVNVLCIFAVSGVHTA